MKRVIIESPFGAPTQEGIDRHVAYARAAALDALNRGEAPFASHLFYPQMLSDASREQRIQGIRAGYEWWDVAEAICFYTDLGWSAGMNHAREQALAYGKPVELRVVNDGRGWTAPTPDNVGGAGVPNAGA